MQIPDYHNSIVNLMASVSTAFGQSDPLYPSLAQLPVGPGGDTPLVLMIVDGLGDELLQRFPDTTLARHRVGRLTSVFPTTTASAITTIATGQAPQQHAITGWFTYLKEIGSVATVLPFRPRYGGPNYSAAGLDPSDFIASAPLSNRLPVDCDTLYPSFIANSDYSRASSGRARRFGYETMGEFFELLERRVNTAPKRFIFAYWPDVDAMAHRLGTDHPELEQHIYAFDAALSATLERLRGSGARFLISADHGLINTAPHHTVRLEDHPALAATLALPLCGEPRAAFCYLRNGREQAFLEYIGKHLAHCCEAIPSAELVARGLFGLGDPHPSLLERIGDYTLLMKGDYVIRDRLLGEKPFSQRGVHGGLSAEELYVPLISVTA